MAGRDQLVQSVNTKIKAGVEAKTLTSVDPIKAEHIDLIFATITEFVSGGDRVQIQHFGSFLRKVQAARVARNPQTNAPINVPARVKLDLQTTIPAFDLTEDEAKALKAQQDKVAAAVANAGKAPAATPAAKAPTAPKPKAAAATAAK